MVRALQTESARRSASLGKYVDYALELSSIRVLALFVEAIREPEGFAAALEKANRRGVPGGAILAHEFYASDTTPGVPEIGAATKRIPEASQKPCLLTHSLGAVTNSKFASEMLDCGVPVTNGVKSLLADVKCAFDYRDYRNRADATPEILDADRAERWRRRLRNGAPPGEPEILQMLRELGVSAIESRVCASAREVVLAADSIGYPVALKTSVPCLMHKSDAGGVHVMTGRGDESTLFQLRRELERCPPWDARRP